MDLQDIASAQRSNTLGDAPVTTPDAFAEQARTADARFTFATSRSATPAPYDRADHAFRDVAEAMRLMGFSPDDSLLNLNAPRPHLSGWVGVQAVNHLGGRCLNEHFDDYHRVVTEGDPEAATAVCSIPSMLLDKADEIDDRFGPPDTVFPNLEVALIAGELPPPGSVDRITERWGVDRVREFYGTSEVSMIACAVDGSRRLVPLLHRLILEIETDGAIVDIRDVDDPTEGSLLVTDPARTAVDLTRYRVGDRVRIHPADPLPRVEVLGRSDDAVNLDGALCHPADLHRAIEATYEPDRETHVIVRDRDPPTTIEVAVVGANGGRESALHDALLETVPALEHALGDELGERVTVTVHATRSSLPAILASPSGSPAFVFESDHPPD